MLVESLLIAAGVVLLPAARAGPGRPRPAHAAPAQPPTSRPTARRYIVAGRRCGCSLLLLVFALSAVILVSAIGALIRDVELHGLVYVFFVLDLLLAPLVRAHLRPARPATSASTSDPCSAVSQ